MLKSISFTMSEEVNALTFSLIRTVREESRGRGRQRLSDLSCNSKLILRRKLIDIETKAVAHCPIIPFREYNLCFRWERQLEFLLESLNSAVRLHKSSITQNENKYNDCQHNDKECFLFVLIIISS